MRQLAWLIIIGLCLQLAVPGPVQAAPEQYTEVKELNFVFLHGAGGNACSFQLLDDKIMEQLPACVQHYQEANAGTEIRVDTLKRCYPGYEDINTWASNIAESIDEYFAGKERLILIGHSMGGKAALYAVAHNIGGLASKVALVVTINSPIKSLDRYYVAGGGSAFDYCRAAWLQADQGICSSVTSYDSSRDGAWVGEKKHWLAFISGEAGPLSEQFNYGGVDPWPRDMDDGILPLSCQHAEGADVIYYGEHGHSDFGAVDEVAESMAEQILRYIFGGQMQFSKLTRGGVFKHEAGWLPGEDYWLDVVGEVPVRSGSLYHKNESYTRWQEWEDTVGEYFTGLSRSSYRISRVSYVPFLTSIQETRWLNPGDPEDGQLYVRTRAAPRNSLQVNWVIYAKGLLPAGLERDHYEVEINTGTPLTGIRQVSWATADSRDLRVQIWSEASRPFRWFKVQWRVYYKEMQQRNVLDEIPAKMLPGASLED